jgi:hypothetical protein
VADAQISNPAVADGASDYQVKPAVEILLKAVSADFDDNGAASSWLPAVLLTSDSGHIIARALDPSVSVAAGGSAEVSWFPGVKRGGGGSGPTTPSLPWVVAWGLGATWLAGHATSAEATLALKGTNDATRFTIAGGKLSVNEGGAYVIFAFSPFDASHWAAGFDASFDPDWTPNGGNSSSRAIYGPTNVHLRAGAGTQEGTVQAIEIYNLADADVPLTLTHDVFASPAPTSNTTMDAYYLVVRISDPIAALF